MKTYTKTHSSKKIAEIHLAKIKKRGGKATMITIRGGFQIEYYFPDSKTKKPSEKVVARKSGIRLKEYKKLHPGTKRELENYL
ncbi:MAG: hypothetical protein A3F72_20095 [Bacteroidetes bacterium RIFCSPLOWO2_12_FULL_35_15]|nr:MAG: hypothetical protein A3F72_20095 [Bacteroidetes bacterium RIFCSPLOWO2_12_FULL_35_15]